MKYDEIDEDIFQMCPNTTGTLINKETKTGKVFYSDVVHTLLYGGEFCLFKDSRN
jgi:hypothetical protein